jgi:hypothetical protein
VPYAGLLLVGVSATGRFVGWPLTVTLGVLGAVVAALAVATVIYGRRHEPADVTAARLDSDAGLAGELRSAHWFATSERHDEWTEFHLDRAIANASGVTWSKLYPPETHPKAWGAAALCAIVAIALPLTIASRRVTASGPGDVVAEAGKAVSPEDLGADLRAKLDALLAAMAGNDKEAREAAIADLEALKKLMASVDPALQKKLDELLKKNPLGSEAQTKTKNLDAEDLAERGDNADSAAGLPEDVRWALEDLAARLANANANRQTNEKNPAASQETGEKGKGSAQAQTADAKPGEASAQMVRQAAADPGAAKLMQGGGGMMGGDSRSGAGGNSGQKPADLGTPNQIALALRKEMIEANSDMAGENVTKEDLRKKTEQGRSAIGLTRAAATTSFDQSRAMAPPIVPEARQPLLQRYFIRR